VWNPRLKSANLHWLNPSQSPRTVWQFGPFFAWCNPYKLVPLVINWFIIPSYPIHRQLIDIIRINPSDGISNKPISPTRLFVPGHPGVCRLRRSNSLSSCLWEMDLVMVRRLFARALDVIRLYWCIMSNWLSLSCNWLCISIYLCNFMYVYIYIVHMILQSCSKIWFTKNWLQTIWGFQSRAPQAVSNLASTRHLSVWAQERCGRPSGSQKPWAMEGTIPWNDDFMPWNDDLLGLSI